MCIYVVFYEFIQFQSVGFAIKHIHKVVEATVQDFTNQTEKYYEVNKISYELTRINPRIQFEFVSKPDTKFIEENFLNDCK